MLVIKQGRDQDPEGRFIRRWCPELVLVPLSYLHTPWTMPEALQADIGCRLGRDYLWPVVDQAAAAKHVRDAVWGVRHGAAFRMAAEAIQNLHGSRASGIPRSPSRPAEPVDSGVPRRRRQRLRGDTNVQLDLDLKA